MTTRLRSAGLFASLWIAITVAACARSAVVDSAPVALVATLFWAVVQGAGLWFAWKNDGPPPRRATDVIAGVGLVAFLLQLTANGLLQALLSLLLWLQAARNPVLRTRRDAYFSLALGMALVAFGATEARDTAFVALVAAYGLAALVAMLHCQEHLGRERQGAQELRDRAAARPIRSPQLAALSLCILAVALAWYLLVPRPPALQFGAVSSRAGGQYSNSQWEREADAGQSPVPPRGSAPRDEGGAKPPRKEKSPPDDSPLDITRSGQDSGEPANAIVMYVQADRPLYLREQAFDRFEHDRWTRTDGATTKLRPDEGAFRLGGPRGVEHRYVVQAVHRGRTAALPLASYAEEIAAPVPVIALARDHSVYLAARMEPGFRYAAISVAQPGEERPISYDSPEPRAAYLQLPEDLTSRIRELAAEAAGPGASPMEKALALESFLRERYAYSFATVLTSQNVTPLDDFLFVAKRGHCEFFASALAVLLRTQGIAARVVNGALAHSYNPVTGFYEVRAFDGHAWVEAYIPGRGWVTFEPTPAYPLPPRDPPTATALEQLKEYTEKLAEQERLEGIHGAAPTVASLFAALDELWSGLALRVRLLFASLAAWIAANAWTLAAAVAVLATLASAGLRQRARLAWWWAKWRVHASSPARIAIVAMRQLGRASPVPALRRAAGETIDEYVARLGREMPERRSDLQMLRTRFNASRYDGRAAAAERAQIIAAFDAVAAALPGA
ncbi:MAG TPA: transglutaminaseTgpA domain-containing protein [Usitatibacter sp.]|nr:transglutaminaseTgpA domain-containing protein [Usitatibacter sp.]